jgi:hypothetical protein
MDAGYQQQMIQGAPAAFQDQVKECWDSIDEETRMSGCFFGFSALGGTAVTWILSSATHALVGGAAALLTSVVGLAILINGSQGKGVDKEDLLLGAIGGMALSNVVMSLAFSALGFSLSIPLSLLYTVVSAASFVGTMALNGKL